MANRISEADDRRRIINVNYASCIRSNYDPTGEALLHNEDFLIMTKVIGMSKIVQSTGSRIK